MKEVKVHKNELLAALKENLGNHAKVFEEALAGYQAKVIALLEKSLADARAGKRVLDRLHIPIPVNQSFEYKRAIRMLEMSAEEFITISVNDFDAYVMDRWHWKQNFLVANSMYSVTAANQLASEDEEV
jgi:hypothetical protein